MRPPAIVVALYPPEQCSLGILSRCEASAMDEFVLHRAEEAFHQRIVRAITLAAHGWRQAVSVQDLLIERVRLARHDHCDGSVLLATGGAGSP